MAKQEDRIETVKKHIKILKDTKAIRGDLKEEAQGEIEEWTDLCEKIDEDLEIDEKEINALEVLPTKKIEDAEDDLWGGYEDEVDKKEQLYGSLIGMYNDVKEHKFVTYLDASYNSTTSVSNTSSTNVVNILQCMNLGSDYNTRLKQLEVKDTIADQKEFVKNELKTIDSDIASNFENVMKDWSGTSVPKFKILLGLRSVIYDQLFDNFADQSNYCKTKWFRRSTNKKGRYCQPKFFIFGYNDESNIPNSVLQRIEDTALNLEKRYHELSEYGKMGEKREVLVEKTFRDTISYFKSALELRKSFYVSSPKLL